MRVQRGGVHGLLFLLLQAYVMGLQSKHEDELITRGQNAQVPGWLWQMAIGGIRLGEQA